MAAHVSNGSLGAPHELTMKIICLKHRFHAHEMKYYQFKEEINAPPHNIQSFVVYLLLLVSYEMLYDMRLCSTETHSNAAHI